MGVVTCRRPMPIADPFGRSLRAAECGRRAAGAVAVCIDARGANVAAVIMEPNAGTNGIVAPDTYWPALRRPRRANAAFLDRRRGDERASAVAANGSPGRRYGEGGRPDLMTLAKGLTGAPIAAGRGGAVRRRRRAAGTRDASYSASPIAAIRWRVRRAWLRWRRTRTEGLIARSRRWAAKCCRELNGFTRAIRLIGDVRGGRRPVRGDRARCAIARRRDRLHPGRETPPGLPQLVRDGVARTAFPSRAAAIS